MRARAIRRCVLSVCEDLERERATAREMWSRTSAGAFAVFKGGGEWAVLSSRLRQWWRASSPSSHWVVALSEQKGRGARMCACARVLTTYWRFKR
jgi:hypothetical protein